MIYAIDLNIKSDDILIRKWINIKCEVVLSDALLKYLTQDLIY